jgi:hypothetical protein
MIFDQIPNPRNAASRDAAACRAATCGGLTLNLSLPFDNGGAEAQSYNLEIEV